MSRYMPGYSPFGGGITQNQQASPYGGGIGSFQQMPMPRGYGMSEVVSRPMFNEMFNRQPQMGQMDLGGSDQMGPDHAQQHSQQQQMLDSLRQAQQQQQQMGGISRPPQMGMDPNQDFMAAIQADRINRMRVGAPVEATQIAQRQDLSSMGNRELTPDLQRSKEMRGNPRVIEERVRPIGRMSSPKGDAFRSRATGLRSLYRQKMGR